MSRPVSKDIDIYIGEWCDVPKPYRPPQDVRRTPVSSPPMSSPRHRTLTYPKLPLSSPPQSVGPRTSLLFSLKGIGGPVEQRVRPRYLGVGVTVARLAQLGCQRVIARRLGSA